MTARVQDINEAKLSRIRAQLASETPGRLVGFQAAGGPAAFSGDDPSKGPFVQPVGSIPDLSELGVLFNEEQVGTEEFSVSSVADVRSWRSIALYCTYDFDAQGQIILLPEVSPDGSEWFPIAVVDAALTQVDPAGSFLNVFGQRTLFLGSTFISPNPLALGTARWKMAFDIEEDFFFRLNAMENIAASPASVNNDLTVKYRMCR